MAPEDADDQHGLVERALRRRWRATGLPTSTPGAAAPTAAEQVRRLGAVQAQEFETTLWSLARRTGEPRAAVLAAFERGEVVRTHALRQTWHLVHRDDLALVQAATADRVHAANAAGYAEHGLDEATLRRAGGVVVRALEAEGPMTRAQVAQRLAAAGVEAAGLRLVLLLMWAELERLVASGPLAGRQHTYAALPPEEAPDPDDAREALAARYLASHGPAAVEDLSAWSSLGAAQVRRALAGLPARREVVEGRELLDLGGVDDAPWASPQVELLGPYDEVLSGLSPRGKRWHDRAGLARERPGTPVGLVVVDGQLAGRWRRVLTARRLAVEVLALRTLTRAEHAALEEQAAALGTFLERPASLVLLR